jgi:HSP20 family molecular chaperone IbpA
MSLFRVSPVFRTLAEDPFFARLPSLLASDPFFASVARPAARLPSMRVPALDVKEQKDSFVVEAEVPGVSKKGT